MHEAAPSASPGDGTQGSAWALRRPTAAQLLTTWEKGAKSGPARRALVLVAAGLPDAGPAELEKLPIGKRDALLFDLRAMLFGERLSCVAECPSCQESVEILLTGAELRLSDPPTAGGCDPGTALGASGSVPPGLLEVRQEGITVKFRLPEIRDLIRMEDEPVGGDPVRALASWCVIEARGERGEISPRDLPESVIAAIATRMAEVDPQADIQLLVVCPTCQHRWPTLFDIASYLWIEVDRFAQRLFTEVHTLARSYGWKEADILAMSDVRRGRYLALLDYEP